MDYEAKPNEPSLEERIQSLEPRGLHGMLALLGALIAANICVYIIIICIVAFKLQFVIQPVVTLLLVCLNLELLIFEAVLLFKRHRLFPQAYIVICCISILSVLVLASADGAGAFPLWSVIWIIYMLKSKRVKNTFIYDFQGNIVKLPPDLEYMAYSFKYDGSGCAPGKDTQAMLPAYVAPQSKERRFYHKPWFWIIAVLSAVLVFFVVSEMGNVVARQMELQSTAVAQSKPVPQSIAFEELQEKFNSLANESNGFSLSDICYDQTEEQEEKDAAWLKNKYGLAGEPDETVFYAIIGDDISNAVYGFADNEDNIRQMICIATAKEKSDSDLHRGICYNVIRACDPSLSEDALNKMAFGKDRTEYVQNGVSYFTRRTLSLKGTVFYVIVKFPEEG
jgi:hypothetical protein